jgi:nicotinamidase-related amidase
MAWRNLMKKRVLILWVISAVSCTSNVIKIGNYDNPQKALLVIDMQVDYIGENAKYPIEKRQIDDLIVTINKIIDEYYKNDYSIIYLRRVFRKNDIGNFSRNYACVEGTSGVEIDPGINIVSKNIFDKYAPDSFSSTVLENYLIENKINELYLCGVMADECVYETALGGYNRNYKINYIANAVGSTSIKNIEKAIKKLNKKGINIVYYSGN